MKTIDCETCEGTGECMRMECYGGPPVEVMGECPDCDGEGTVEVPEDPMDVTRSMCQ